ncbi:MAG TPA: hypothetical protein VHC22_17465 [Pirellulales bacterium]|nr:hypothetical protein [Pirellulales bacterium]
MSIFRAMARRAHLPWIVLVAASLVTYVRVLPTFFVQDDFNFLRNLDRPLPNRVMITGGLPEYLRPLTTYWLPLTNKAVWGLNSYGFHISQMAFMLLTVYALYRIVFRLTQSPLAASVTAAVYGLSKVHLYTLCWISGGIDNAAGCFMALLLLAIVRYEQGEGSLWSIGAACAAGLLSKESTIIGVVAWGGATLVRSVLARWVPAEKDAHTAERTDATKAATILGRWLSPGDLRIGLTLTGVFGVYMLLRASLISSHKVWGCDLSRFAYVIKSSVLAVLPIPETTTPIANAWVLLPLAVAAGACFLRPAGKFHEAVLGLLIWVLHAAIFAVSIRLPPGLQLYYAHFNVIGLALLAGLCCQGVLERFSFRWSALPLRAATTLLLGFYGYRSALVVQQGIDQANCPAMFEARYSKQAFDQLQDFMAEHPYQTVIFLETSDTMWWAMGRGDMIYTMFPGVAAKFDGRDGYRAEPGLKSDTSTLVVHQVAELQFNVVR